MLKQNGKVTKPRMSSTDIGFSITPQINALGRLEDPRQGVKFLIGSDRADIQEVGKILLELNEARREIERSIFQDVVQDIEQGIIDLSTENVIIAARKGWPPGVIGLVASRLVGAYGKPTILLHLTDKGIAKGSCRSIPEFNMFQALYDAGHILEQFGGHAQAAGLSLKIDQIPALKQILEEQVASKLTPFDLQQKLVLDAHAQLSDINQKLVNDLEHLEPFGNSNTHPAFYIKDVVMVQKPKLLKEAHIKCMVFADGVIKPVMFFNRPELFEKLQACGPEPFSIAATVHENHWNGRVSVELTGLDIAFSDKGIK
jgi:single-stranded-DNA-specific exonuclease